MPPIPARAQKSRALIELVLRCLAKFPQNRPTSVELYNTTLQELRTAITTAANQNDMEEFEDWDLDGITGPYRTP